MSLSAISAATASPSYQQSYPVLANPPVAADKTSASASASLAVTIPAPAETDAATTAKVWRSAKGDYRDDPGAPPTAAEASDTFGFKDFLDIINPLQHIPGVSMAYRALTGDTIKPAENIAGGFLYGGAFGGLVALATSTFSELQAAGDSSVADSSSRPATAVARNSKFGGVGGPGGLTASA